jgi:C1A family cysteine protease
MGILKQRVSRTVSISLISFEVIIFLVAFSIGVYQGMNIKSIKADTNLNYGNAMTLGEFTQYPPNIMDYQKYLTTELSQKSSGISAALKNQLQSLSPLRQAEIGYNLQNVRNGIKSKGTTWTAGLTAKSVLTDDQLKMSLGLKGNPPKLPHSAGMPKALVNLPDSFDWRNVGGENLISPVRDQGQCGSCWAFAAVAALEGNTKAYYNNTSINPDLSEQDLISCGIPWNGQPCPPAGNGKGGCCGAYEDDTNGHQISSIFSNIFANQGISQETCFPYTATDSSCSGKCSTWQTDAYKTVSYEAIPLTDNIQQNIYNIEKAVVSDGPVEVGFYVYSDFENYQSGIYQHTTDILKGGHAVTVVGFGKDDGRDYYIVKNSWGSTWGDNGYFRIYADDSNISSWYALAVKQPNPPASANLKVICTDNDKDGYCYWGIGPKPTDASACPASCKNQPIEDCDDSKADKNIQDNCGVERQKFGTLTVSTNVNNSSIYVKDLNTGSKIFRGIANISAPLTIQLDPGTREITVQADNYIPLVSKVNISVNETATLSASLIHIMISGTDGTNKYIKGKVNIYGQISISSYDRYEIDYASLDGTKKGQLCVKTSHPTSNIFCSVDVSGLADGGYYLNMSVFNGSQEIQDVPYRVGVINELMSGWPVHVNTIFDPVVGDVNNNGSNKMVTVDWIPESPGGYWGRDNFVVYDKNGSSQVIDTLTKGTNKSSYSVYNFSMHDKLLDFGNMAYNTGFGSIDGSGNYQFQWPEVVVGSSTDFVMYPLKPMYDASNKIFFGFAETTNTYLYGFDYQGNALPNYPITLANSSSQIQFFGATLVKDNGKSYVAFIDEDKSNLGVLYLNIYSEDGTLIKKNTICNYPGDIIMGDNSNIVAADLNEDGNSEIILAFTANNPTYNNSKSKVLVFDAKGNLISTVFSYDGRDDYSVSDPVIADLGGGTPEIVFSFLTDIFASTDNFIKSYDINGKNHLNINIGHANQATFSNKTIGDVDGDSQQEILISYTPAFYYTNLFGADSGILIYSKDGVLKKKIKISAFGADENLYQPTLADLDGDGKPEIIQPAVDDPLNPYVFHKVVSSYFVLKPNYIGNNFAGNDWPTYMHDFQHTGCYDCASSVNSVTSVTSVSVDSSSWQSWATHHITWNVSSTAPSYSVYICKPGATPSDTSCLLGGDGQGHKYNNITNAYLDLGLGDPTSNPTLLAPYYDMTTFATNVTVCPNDSSGKVIFDNSGTSACAYKAVSVSNPATCFDTDGPKNFTTKGVAYGINNAETKWWTDYCVGSNVYDFTCKTNNDPIADKLAVWADTYACPNGCKDGACVNGNANSSIPDLMKQLQTKLNSASSIKGGAACTMFNRTTDVYPKDITDLVWQVKQIAGDTDWNNGYVVCSVRPKSTANYCVAASLPNNRNHSFCIDSSGFAGEINKSVLPSGTTACSNSNPNLNNLCQQTNISMLDIVKNSNWSAGILNTVLQFFKLR